MLYQRVGGHSDILQGICFVYSRLYGMLHNMLYQHKKNLHILTIHLGAVPGRTCSVPISSFFAGRGCCKRARRSDFFNRASRKFSRCTSFIKWVIHSHSRQQYQHWYSWDIFECASSFLPPAWVTAAWYDYKRCLWKHYQTCYCAAMHFISGASPWNVGRSSTLCFARMVDAVRWFGPCSRGWSTKTLTCRSKIMAWHFWM